MPDFSALLAGTPDATVVDWASAAPSGGNEGDVKVRVDKPLIGAVQRKVGGVWTNQSNTYTFASLPAAASYPGAVVTVSDWNQDFFSDGSAWIPVGKVLRMSVDMTAGSFVAAGATTTTFVSLATTTFPAGLVRPNCAIVFEGLMEFTGVVGAKATRLDLPGTVNGSLVNMSASASSTHSSFRKRLLFPGALNVQKWGANSSSAADYIQSGTTALGAGSGDWSVDQTVNWGWAGSTGDTARYVYRSVVIEFP